MSEKKKPAAFGRDNTGSSPEKLNEYIRVGSIGGSLLIVGLVILAAALIIWGFTGRIPVTTTQTGIIIDTKEESHSCLCFMDVNEKAGVLPAGTPASIKTADGSVYNGFIDYMGEDPLSAEEIRIMYGSESKALFRLSDWMFSNLLKDGSYYYMIRIHTEEDMAEHWHDLATVTLVLREVQPISYLIR